MTISGVAYSLPATQAAKQSEGMFGDNSFFGTILDTINPLQHIPIVSNIYKSLTGDTQNAFSHVVGNTIFGGPISGAFAIASEVYSAAKGSKADASKTALVADNKNQNEANSPVTAQKKMRISTKDWIYSVATAAEQAPAATAANAEKAYKMHSSTKDWLSGGTAITA